MGGYSKAKGRSNAPSSKSFAGIPRFVMELEQYTNLSCHAKALLLEAARQYRGKNNGDICLTWSLMNNRGVGCKSKVYQSINELLEAELITVTRQGQKGSSGIATLYALAWASIDECNGKLDVLPTNRAALIPKPASR